MKHRYQIRLDTQQDLIDFVNIASMIEGSVMVVDGEGQCVSGRSVLGMMYAMTFSEIWCESDIDIYSSINRFVV